MKVSYRYEPDMCRFWLGATDGKHYKEYGLQHWMSIKDVIDILNKSEEEVIKLGLLTQEKERK